jgi:hypothetical protein
LVKESPLTIHTEKLKGKGEAPETLLYLLVRHALLWEYAEAAFQLGRPWLPEPELIDFGEPQSTMTPWRQLERPLTYSDPPLGDVLFEMAHGQPGSPEVARLASFLQDLTYTAKLPAAALERLLSETLDLSTHRLDAWITSCATSRLDWMRSQKPNGIYIGGYGWVENVMPGQSQPGGYVHAPSLAHAAAASILRSGYLARQGTGQDAPLAVDLSSERVRKALYLLDGIRKGQPLGALLGYRFERGLHENYPGVELDKFIHKFRDLVPLVAGKLMQKQGEVKMTAADNVVDGLALLRRWQAGKTEDPTGTDVNVWNNQTIPFGQQGWPSNGGTAAEQAEFEAVVKELHNMEQAVDAVSDLMVAESVYQAVQGNHVRSGATLDALSRGERPPSEMEVVRTPRTGIGVNHRIAVLFSTIKEPNDPLLAKWPASSNPMLQVRRLAEPCLNAWAARLLGDPARVKCRVEELNSQGLPNGVIMTIRLSDLELSPIDVIYEAVAIEPLPGSGDLEYRAERSLIEQRIERMYLKANGGARFRIVFDRDPDWSLDDLSFPELLEVAVAARELIQHARAAEPKDLILAPLKDVPPAQYNWAEMEKRAGSMVSAFNDAVDNLNECVYALTPRSDDLSDALSRLSYFGVDGSFPHSLSGDLDMLLKQAEGLLPKLLERKNNYLEREKEIAQIPNGEERFQSHVALLQEIFGPHFRILPRFKPHAAEHLENSLAASESLQGYQQAAQDWFMRTARVRDGAARLDRLLTYAEAIAGSDPACGDSLTLEVAQIPYAQGDRWVGIAPPKGKPTLSGRLSLVLHLPGIGFHAAQWIAGLIVDEIVEVIPSAAETTGIAYQYNAPGAAPPQAVLLAVPPDTRGRWSLDLIEETLLETLDLAHLRAVDPDTLPQVGHFLPGLFFARNVNQDTIEVDFSQFAQQKP